MHNTLESQRWFPYVAWALVVGFAAFTANLAVTMQQELGEISQATDRIERALIEAGRISAPDDSVVPGATVDEQSEIVIE